MKISAVPSFANTSADASGAPDVRTLQMTTKVTPLDYPPSMRSGELSNPDINGQQTTIEATEPLSPQYAKLARERRALQRERRELELLRKGIETKPQGSATVDLSRLQTKPLDVLLEAGVTYDQLTEALIANQGNPEFNQLKAEMKALQEGIDKKFTDRDTQERQRVLREMRSEANTLVSVGQEFELIKATRAIPDVMRLIEQTYDETGEILDVKEALGLYEAELFKDAERLTAIEKVKNKFMPAPLPPQQRQPHGIRTLTNRHTASPVLGRKERALAAFYGNLTNKG